MLVLALSHRRIFAALLPLLDWPTLHAILDTSKQARELFNDAVLRDIILYRFVPAYEACRRSAVIIADTPVPVEIYHLHLFLISQNFPLHLYPTYALRKLSAATLYDRDTPFLVALAHAHSRFILLLQSLVHSSPLYTIPTEPSHSHLFEAAYPPLPELTTPAPLCYKTNSPSSSPTPSVISRTNSSSTPSSKSTSRRSSTRPSSMFNSRTAPLPAPSAFSAYSYSWRRSRTVHRSSIGSEVYSQSQSDSENDLIPPRRLYAPSSYSKSSISRSPTPTRPTYSSGSPSPPPSPLHFSTSPHDLAYALSRTRAPVLRVYIPTAANPRDQQTIIRCEEQLVKMGLWNCLSIGDIVVNVGHITLSDQPGTRLSVAAASDRRRSLLRPQSLNPASVDNWLIFNGTFLVPFTASPIQVPDALTLPSPFYYTHILPRLANPVYILRTMPKFTLSSHAPTHLHPGGYTRPEVDDIPMRLVALPTRVATMYANGVAVVRRYKWLAKVFVHASGPEDELELGVGWQGEWVLEGDGTKEGREALLQWLLGRRRQDMPIARMFSLGAREQEQKEEGWEWEWELVREMCKKQRLWLRLLNVRKPGDEDSKAGNVKMDIL